MNKIKEIMEQYGLSEHQVTRFTGQPSRSDTLRLVANGEREVINVNLNILTSFARGLGLRLEDLVEDYDLDGSTSQVRNIKKYVNSIRKWADNITEFKNGGYVAVADAKYNKEEYKLKELYYFLNSDLPHAQQTTNDIYLLNNSYLNTLWNKDINRNRTLAKITPSFSRITKTYVIYSPLKNGGDLTLVADIYNKKKEFLFSELIGCEWIDTDNNQSVCYYKAHTVKDSIKPSDVKTIEKKEISELEFYKGFNTQLKRFNVVEQ